MTNSANPIASPSSEELNVTRGCSCADWAANIDKINAPILNEFARGRGKGYTGKVFAFCPWCAKPLGAPVSDDMLDWDVSILDRAISDYESSIASLDSLDSPMFADERARRIIQRDALRALRARTVKQDLRVGPADDVARAVYRAGRESARTMYGSDAFGLVDAAMDLIEAYAAVYQDEPRSFPRGKPLPLSGASDATSEDEAAVQRVLRAAKYSAGCSDEDVRRVTNLLVHAFEEPASRADVPSGDDERLIKSGHGGAHSGVYYAKRAARSRGFENRCEKTPNEGRHVCLLAKDHDGDCRPMVNAPWPPVPSGEARETLLDLAQAWVQAERAHAREEEACVWDMFPSESFKSEFNVARLKAYEAFESAARSVPLSGASDTTSEAEARAMVNRLLGAYATVRGGYDDPADVRARNGEALVAASDAIVAALRSSPSPSILQKDTTEGTNDRIE